VHRAQAEKALIFYDRLLGAAGSPDPVVQLDLARASREAATIQYVVGRFQDAVASLERSIQLLDAVEAKRPGDREVTREQIQSRTKLGLFLWHTLKTSDRPLAELRRALSDAERLVGVDPHSVDARTDLAWCLHDLGSVYLEKNQLDLALAAHRRAIEINRKLIEELPDDMRRRISLAENLNNLGLLTMKRDPDQAEAAIRQGVGLLELASRHRLDVRCVTSLGSLLNNWGNLAARRGQTELALERFVRGLALVEDALKREPGHTELRYNALNMHGSRANLFTSLGRHAEAVADWDRVLELNDIPEDRLAYRLSRIMALIRTADYARGVAEAEDLAGLQSASIPMIGADLYNYACVFGLASTAASNDKSLEPAERKGRGDSYAGSALRWLERAAEAGFLNDAKNCEHARSDPDLAPLHGRAEFEKLLRGHLLAPSQVKGMP
jgi:tetratricopeptide (TPR) repeat protein